MKNYNRNRINKLIIMQGHSSSGKSSFARQFAKDTDVIISTDDYFMEHGVYKFNEEYLEQHHKSTFNDCVKLMKEHSGTYEKENAGFSIWLDNTNTKPEHVKPYLDKQRNSVFKLHTLEWHHQFLMNALQRLIGHLEPMRK